MRQIGVVGAIARFPVKSMAGEHLPEVALGFNGLPGDRLHAFVQADLRSPFPWLTGRECPELVRFQATLDSSAGRPEVMVAVPGADGLPVGSPELLAELERRSGKRLFLLSDHRGSYDIAHVSVILRSTVTRLAEAGGVADDPTRFRMNFVIDSDAPAFAESEWVGRTIVLGDTARVHITELDKRCAMVNIDPSTAAVQPGALRAVADLNDARAGAYGSVIGIGPVRSGDPVYLADS